MGCTGAGRSVFAAALARRLHPPHVELDALHWNPDRTEVEDAVFRERTARALPPDGAWVANENDHVVRNLAGARAETLVWRDDSFPCVFWWLLRREPRRAER